MSTANIYAKVLELADGFHRQRAFHRHLDIGAGRGELIAKFKEHFQTEAAACDYTDELMKLPGQRVDNVFGDRNLVCSCAGMENYS